MSSVRVACASLFSAVTMRNRQPDDRRCSYVVVLQSASASTTDLRELASYLSMLGVAGCDVVILDPAPRHEFELHARVLRWVGRHAMLRAEARGGGVDIVRAAISAAACEKVIVAADDVRYTPEAVAQMCDLLEMHEVVQPQDYLESDPWWGGIEAGRILLHRGIEPQPDHAATFGFRRTAVRSLRILGPAAPADGQVRRLAAVGAEVHPAPHVFVRREPGPLAEWLASRPRMAGSDFILPIKTAFFLSLLPFFLLLAVVGGAEIAGGYAGVIAFGSVVLAMRGRSGASMFFPLRACLFAPVWVLERSLSVYWALFRKLRGNDQDVVGIAAPAESRERHVM